MRGKTKAMVWLCQAVLLLFGGCFYEPDPPPELQTFERIYPQSFGEVWAAAVAVMSRQYHVVANANENVIDMTTWNYDLVGDEKTGIHSESWRERYRLKITVQTAKEGILVTLHPLLERRVDVGEYGLEYVKKHTEGQWEEHIEIGHPKIEWHRKSSDGRREHRIMAQIQDYLNRHSPLRSD